MTRRELIEVRSVRASDAHAWLKRLVWLIAAAVSAAGLRDYRIDNDLSQWVPDLSTTGAIRSYAVVGFERDTVDERALAERLCSLPAVAFCADRRTVETGGRLLGVTPEEFVVGRDGAYVGIFLFPRAETSDDSFIGEVRRVLDGTPCGSPECFNVGGPAVFHIALNQASQQRLPYIMLLILLLGGVLLWWLTRRFRAACWAMLAITLSQIVLVGALSWFRVPMDASLSMVPPLMMSCGFSYAAHRSLRPDIAHVLILCVATTALGFGTFVFADVPPVRMFAVAGVLGLAIVWLAVVALVPCQSQGSDGQADRIRSRFLLLIVQQTWARHPRAVLGAALVLSASAVFSLPYLRFETDPLNYFPRAERLVVDFTTLNERLTGMLSGQWSVGGEADPTPLISRAPGVRKIIDITTIVGDGRRHLWCLADNDALPALVQLDESLRGWARKADVAIEWRGVAAQLGEVSRILTHVAAGSLPAMGLVAALAVGLLGRSVVLGLISLWVNLLPVGVLMLIAAAMRWPLDLPSLMIGAIAVGMAVDDTLHITSAWRRTNSAAQAVAECFRPCAGSSMIAAACLFCFAISEFAPIRQFGVLLAVAAVFAMLADLLLLPTLLTMFMGRGSTNELVP